MSHGDPHRHLGADRAVCSIKLLPPELWVDASISAARINAANAPDVVALSLAALDVVISTEHLAVLTSRYWGSGGAQLTVGFMDGPASDLRSRILSHMNAWGAHCNVRFVETATDPRVRISRTPKDGHWSNLGTDVLLVPADQPTMNLESFTMSTPDSEFVRVIRHETGHTLGFPHEHLHRELVDRIDEQKAIDYFKACHGWDKATVFVQILTPLADSALMKAAQVDVHSIMCPWLPASIMKDGIAVDGGADIDSQDQQFAASVYPPFAGWQELDNNPATVQIVADGNALYQRHDNGRIWVYTGTPFTGWDELDNNPATVEIVAADGHLYQRHDNGRIWVYTGIPFTGWEELDNNPATVQIVAAAEHLYQRHDNGSIWGYMGIPFTGWEELDSNSATVQIVAAAEHLYQRQDDGSVWVYTGIPFTGWEELDNNPATVQIAASEPALCQLHDDGRVWLYTGTPLTGWQELDNNPDNVQIVVDWNSLYRRLENGHICLYAGATSACWQELDNNPAAVDIASSGGHLYQRHHDGRIRTYCG